MLRLALLALVTVSAMLSACSPTRFFYYPNRKLYLDPEKLNLRYEMMQFPSLNGKNLFALLFRTTQNPRGVVVHFHGNYGNVSNHFLGSTFLLDAGFDLLVFDYQGYGASEGRPSPKRTIEDGLAAVRFAAAHNRNPEGGIFILGQSLGGAVAIPVMAQCPEVKAAVIQSAFSSYRKIGRDVLKRNIILWPLVPIYPLFLGTKYDPIRHVDKIAPRPILFIHGTEDRTIPLWMTERLYEKAQEPAQLWIVERADHNGLRAQAGEEYDERVSAFFIAASSGATNKR